MRRFLLAAVMYGAASVAQAADMPDLPFLRGSFTEGLSTATVNWGGAYIGGHASHGAADMDFTNSGKDLLEKLLNNVDVEAQFNISQWPLAGKAHTQSSGFGGFIGYNFQFTEAIIGVELNYTHGNFFGSNSGSQSRVFQYPDRLRDVRYRILVRLDEDHRLRLAAGASRIPRRQFPALWICRPRAGAGEHQSQGRCGPSLSVRRRHLLRFQITGALGA